MQQTTGDKIVTFGVGAGGLSMKLFDVASYAQAIGMIVGALVVCVQLYILVRGLLKKPPQ